MTPGGWIFLGASWLVILALTAFSMYRVLRAKEQDSPPPPAPPR
jgi:hypothetical protein